MDGGRKPAREREKQQQRTGAGRARGICAAGPRQAKRAAGDMQSVRLPAAGDWRWAVPAGAVQHAASPGCTPALARPGAAAERAGHPPGAGQAGHLPVSACCTVRQEPQPGSAWLFLTAGRRAKAALVTIAAWAASSVRLADWSVLAWAAATQLHLLGCRSITPTLHLTLLLRRMRCRCSLPAPPTRQNKSSRRSARRGSPPAA